MMCSTINNTSTNTSTSTNNSTSTSNSTNNIISKGVKEIVLSTIVGGTSNHRVITITIPSHHPFTLHYITSHHITYPNFTYPNVTYLSFTNCLITNPLNSHSHTYWSPILSTHTSYAIPFYALLSMQLSFIPIPLNTHFLSNNPSVLCNSLVVLLPAI